MVAPEEHVARVGDRVKSSVEASFAGTDHELLMMNATKRRTLPRQISSIEYYGIRAGRSAHERVNIVEFYLTK
jgi:hypothetical protein